MDKFAYFSISLFDGTHLSGKAKSISIDNEELNISDRELLIKSFGIEKGRILILTEYSRIEFDVQSVMGFTF